MAAGTPVSNTDKIQPKSGDQAEGMITFPVTGMTCAACQSFLERTLSSYPGVKAASVNLMLHNASVRYDPALVSVRRSETPRDGRLCCGMVIVLCANGPPSAQSGLGPPDV